MVQLLWKTIWKLFNMLNIQLSFGPTIPLLGLFPREANIYIHVKITYECSS